MSFCEVNNLIQEGDTAVVYLSINAIYPIKVDKKLSHSTKYGTFKHADIIGKPYGTRVKCTNGSVVHVLQGSPELWTTCLPHRTQILYSTDISFITLQLDLKPGSVVFESGTGSASLSHSIIRNIYPTGHLYTFEFHEQRCQAAAKEFEEHRVKDYVTATHRDVCNDGFGLAGLADAVFLDLPNPWKVLQSAKDAFKVDGGRLCSFSPCIEQVQKTCEQLSKLGFVNIRTYETLKRIFSCKRSATIDFDFNINNNAITSGNENKKTKSSGGVVDEKTTAEDKDDDTDEDTTVDTFSLKPLSIQPGHTGFLTFATLLNKNFS